MNNTFIEKKKRKKTGEREKKKKKKSMYARCLRINLQSAMPNIEECCLRIPERNGTYYAPEGIGRGQRSGTPRDIGKSFSKPPDVRGYAQRHPHRF